MGTPTADKLELYYASKYLASDGATLTAFVADAGGSTTTLVDAALTQADDYWNGAVVIFKGNTTAALKGIPAHVKDFDAASDTLTFYKALPAAPAAGDQYHLILGGNYRGDTQVYGLKAAGQWPEIENQAIPDMANLKVSKVSAYCGAGTGYFDFDYSDSTLCFKAPGDSAYGPTVAVSTDTTTYTLYSETASRWVKVYRSGALPGSDQADKTVAFTIGEGVIIPDIEGDEAELSGGKVRHRLLVLKNADGSNAMVGLDVYLSPPAGTATTLTSAATTTAGNFTANSLADWPTSGFWVYNVDKDDCRYVLYRSGNTAYFAAAGTGLRGLTAEAWESGDDIVPMPDADCGWDEGTANQYEDPTDEETPPDGIAFSAPYSTGTALAHPDVDMAASGQIGLWLRETIVEGNRAREDLTPSVNVRWS